MAKNTFGTNLRLQRKAKGWSYERLAKELDARRPHSDKATSKSYLHALEAGTKPNPSADYVAFLASALGCTPADLWDDAEAFVKEATALLRKIPKDARPTVLMMLSGAVEKAA